MRGGGGAVVAPPPPLTLPAMSDSALALRAGDADRQATIDRLAAHSRAGRLSADELEERTATATGARTRGELAALEADLPPAEHAAAAEPAEEVAHRRRARREHVVTYVAVIAFLWVIWAATGAGYPWPIWPMAGWGLGLVLDLWGGGRGHHRPELPPSAGPPAPPGLPGQPGPTRRARG